MCKYCMGNKHIKDYELSGSYYAIENGNLVHKENCLDDYYSYTESIPINFCPICGEKFEKEDDEYVS